MRAATRSSFAVSGSTGEPVVGISGSPSALCRSSAGAASGRISSATASAPGNRLAAASSAPQAVAHHRPECAVDPFSGRLGRLARDEGGGIELDHDRDVEARRGRVEDNLHLAHRAHPHPEDTHRRPRLEAVDGAAEAHQERHPVLDAGPGMAPRGLLLAQPERLLAQLQHVGRPLRQLDRHLGRGARLRRPGEPGAGKQDGHHRHGRPPRPDAAGHAVNPIFRQCRTPNEPPMQRAGGFRAIHAPAWGWECKRGTHPGKSRWKLLPARARAGKVPRAEVTGWTLAGVERRCRSTALPRSTRTMPIGGPASTVPWLSSAPAPKSRHARWPPKRSIPRWPRRRPAGRDRVPVRGVAGADRRDAGQGRIGQAARAGRLTAALSPSGAIVSRVM